MSKFKKEDLKTVIELHTQALKLVPDGHALRGKLCRMLASLENRLETFDEFQHNPYKTHTTLPKYNSDVELDLGEYDTRD